MESEQVLAWLSWMGLCFAGWVVAAYILTRIQTKHPDTYAKLGSPIMFGSAFSSSTWRFTGLAVFGILQPSGDSSLRAAAWLLRLWWVLMPLALYPAGRGAVLFMYVALGLSGGVAAAVSLANPERSTGEPAA